MSRSEIIYGSGGQGGAYRPGVDVSMPVAGHYLGKLRSGGVLVGIKLWFGPPRDPVTGELMDRSYRWQAEANGNYVEFDDVWPACADEPISAETYLAYTAKQRWAEQNAPNSSYANPHRRHDPLVALLPF